MIVCIYCICYCIQSHQKGDHLGEGGNGAAEIYIAARFLIYIRLLIQVSQDLKASIALAIAYIFIKRGPLDWGWKWSCRNIHCS